MDINVRDILWRTLFVDDKLTQPLVQWYASLVETVSLPDAGVAFSPVNQAFVAIKRAAAADAEQFTNEREMRALCAIIGGIFVISSIVDGCAHSSIRSLSGKAH